MQNSFISKSLLAGALTALLCNQASALNPTQGLYGGIELGGSYTPNVNFYFSNPLTGLDDYGSLKYKVFGNIGGEIGYRIDHVRLEIEPWVNYNNFSTLDLGEYVIRSSNNSPGLYMKGGTTIFAGMFNAFYDFYTEGGDSGFSPYAGLGIGYAYIQNSVQFYYNNAAITSSYTASESSAAVQGIVGLGYFLDDFTWFGLDYRYFTTRNIGVLDARMQVNSVNVSFNGSFCL